MFSEVGTLRCFQSLASLVLLVLFGSIVNSIVQFALILPMRVYHGTTSAFYVIVEQRLT